MSKWSGGAMLHAVEKTFLVAQPAQLVALTSPVACYQAVINQCGHSKRRKPAGKGVKKYTAPPKGGQLSTLWHSKVPKTKSFQKECPVLPSDGQLRIHRSREISTRPSRECCCIEKPASEHSSTTELDRSRSANFRCDRSKGVILTRIQEKPYWSCHHQGSLRADEEQALKEGKIAHQR